MLVVGAGPAGAAAALQAKRLRPELAVGLLDKAAFPRDKACGDGIAPHAADELDKLGASDALTGATPISRLRLRAPDGFEVARGVQRPNYVVARRLFDARLVAAATARGVELRRERLRMLRQDGDHVVVNESLRARVVVGADGANSTVRRLLGIAPNPPGRLAIAVRGYAPAPPGQRELFIGMVPEGWPAYVWSFSSGDGTANVGYGLLRSRLQSGRADLHGRLRALLPWAEPEPESLRAHHLPFSSHRPAVAHGGVLLAGDAASLINPLTGEGIYYALLSGRLAGTAAARAPRDPGPLYRRLLRRELGPHLRQTSVLARLVRLPAIVRAALRAAERSPRVFDGLVEVGLGRGTLSPADIGRVALQLPLLGRAEGARAPGRSELS